MVYRNYNVDQLLNKIQNLEEKIADLEAENSQLKTQLLNKPASNLAEGLKALQEAVEKNPEFFLSTKEKKQLRKRKLEEKSIPFSSNVFHRHKNWKV